MQNPVHRDALGIFRMKKSRFSPWVFVGALIAVVIAAMFVRTLHAVIKRGGDQDIHATKTSTEASLSTIPSSRLLSTETGYKICDNAITRTISPQALQAGVASRMNFHRDALKRMTTLLNAHMNEVPPYDRCRRTECATSPQRGWSGLKHNHERWDMMGNISVPCPEIRSFATGDEEKRFCWSSELVANKECVIFSIGSKNQWGFEEAAFASTQCKIHTFDCTLRGRGMVPPGIADRVTFHPICIGSAEQAANDPQFKTMRELVKLAGVDRVTFLKMDIEGFEYDVVTHIIEDSKDILATTGVDIFPDQMAVEFHYLTMFPVLPFYGRDLSMGEIFLHFESYFRDGGYALAIRRDNRFCYHCTEVTLVRVKC